MFFSSDGNLLQDPQNHGAMKVNQEPLPLVSKHDRHNMPVSTRYRKLRDGLVEEIGSSRIVYGDWHKLFGCWVVTQDRKAREVLPDWSILDPKGGSYPAEQISCTRNLTEINPRKFPLGAKATIRFAEYFYRTPNIIRNLAANFLQHQWCVLDMCFQVPGFWRFLHEERANNRLGYVSACISLAMMRSPLNRADRRNLAFSISQTRRRYLLSELVGWECQNQHVRLLEKTSLAVVGEQISDMLLAYDDGECAKVLRHANHISSELIDATLQLPEGFVHSNIHALLEDGVSVETLCLQIEKGIEHLTPQQKRDAGRAFGKLCDEDEFCKWCDRWTETGAYNVCFPLPPVSLPAPFLALTSYDFLVKEGRQMKNCVASYWREILEGDIYFYHWCGDEEATVSLLADGNVDWFVVEALGVENTKLSDETLEEIYALIEENLDYTLSKNRGNPAEVDLTINDLLHAIEND